MLCLFDADRVERWVDAALDQALVVAALSESSDGSEGPPRFEPRAEQEVWAWTSGRHLQLGPSVAYEVELDVHGG